MTKFVLILLGAFCQMSSAAFAEDAVRVPFALMTVSSISPSDAAGGRAEVTLSSLATAGLELKLQCSGTRTSLEVRSKNTTQHLTVGDFYGQGCFSYIKFLSDVGIQQSTVVELRYYGSGKFPGLLINRFAFIPSGGDSPFELH